jgi:hypothetical protein
VTGPRKVSVTADESHTVGGNLDTLVTHADSLQVSGDRAVKVDGRVDATTKGLHNDTFRDDHVSRHVRHHVLIVGQPDAKASSAVHVEGPATVYVAALVDVSSPKVIKIRCGNSEISLTPDAISVTSTAITLVASDTLTLKGNKVVVSGGDSVTVGATKVTAASSGATVALDSNATVQGAQVQLKSGGGSSSQDSTQPVKKTTITLTDGDGKPLALQRVVLREGGDGGDERMVVLDEQGSIVVEGDGPFDAIVPDLPDAKPQ